MDAKTFYKAWPRSVRLADFRHAVPIGLNSSNDADAGDIRIRSTSAVNDIAIFNAPQSRYYGFQEFVISVSTNLKVAICEMALPGIAPAFVSRPQGCATVAFATRDDGAAGAPGLEVFRFMQESEHEFENPQAAVDASYGRRFAIRAVMHFIPRFRHFVACGMELGNMSA
jgi:hypothetical protein